MSFKAYGHYTALKPSKDNPKQASENLSITSTSQKKNLVGDSPVVPKNTAQNTAKINNLSNNENSSKQNFLKRPSPKDLIDSGTKGFTNSVNRETDRLVNRDPRINQQTPIPNPNEKKNDPNKAVEKKDLSLPLKFYSKTPEELSNFLSNREAAKYKIFLKMEVNFFDAIACRYLEAVLLTKDKKFYNEILNLMETQRSSYTYILEIIQTLRINLTSDKINIADARKQYYDHANRNLHFLYEISDFILLALKTFTSDTPNNYRIRSLNKKKLDQLDLETIAKVLKIKIKYFKKGSLTPVKVPKILQEHFFSFHFCLGEDFQEQKSIVSLYKETKTKSMKPEHTLGSSTQTFINKENNPEPPKAMILEKKCLICDKLQSVKNIFTNRCDHCFCWDCIKKDKNLERISYCFNKKCPRLIDIDALEEFILQKNIEESQSFGRSNTVSSTDAGSKSELEQSERKINIPTISNKIETNSNILTKVKCGRCKQIVSETQTFLNKSCEHIICSECLEKYLKLKQEKIDFKYGFLNISCPIDICQFSLDQTKLYHFMMKRSDQEYEEKLFNCPACNELISVILKPNTSPEYLKCRKCIKYSCSEHKRFMEECFCFCVKCHLKTINKDGWNYCSKCDMKKCITCFQVHCTCVMEIESLGSKPELEECLECGCSFTVLNFVKIQKCKTNHRACRACFFEGAKENIRAIGYQSMGCFICKK